MRQPLLVGWSVRAVGGAFPDSLAEREVPASVPGCVTTDLLAAGLVPDPYLDRNEEKLAWIGRTRWRFGCSFEAGALAPEERADLVCEGLDTVARLELNGRLVGESANMHRRYRFDLRPALQAGSNRLEVTFDAPLEHAERMSEVLGPRPHTNTHPFNAIRKMACNFGWDWGPDLPTSGIWRPIAIERWRVARLASVRPVVAVEAHDGQGTAPTGTVAFHVQLERAAQVPLRLRVRVGDVVASSDLGAGDSDAVVDVRVPEAELWWPAGYGAQPLYDAEVVLAEPSAATALSGSGAMLAPASDGAQRELDRWHGRLGFRTVSLDTSDDEAGTRFEISVNGRPISVRGANWIPDDCFPHRVEQARYRARLVEARAANMNLLRVWGGGIYESEDFYDVADELGILVWQDFLFACAAYAEEDPLRGEVVAEARDAVTRLCPHPSLALWNGCNENLWGYEDWGWKDRLGDLSWGSGYYHDMLPAIVGELDPARPYSPGSPWSFHPELHPNEPRHGTMHVWDVWNQRDYLAYGDYEPRFVSEFGFQGPPAWSTLTRAVHDRPLAVDGASMVAHQKAADGMAKLARGLEAHLPAPRSVEEWHWATSLNQARAVTFGVEHWRSLTPRCAGVVVWQLNDCWPVISWAAIDGDGRRKPLWYALRRAFADRLLTLQCRGGVVSLVAVNDGQDRWTAALGASRRGFDGTIMATEEVRIDVPAGESLQVPLGEDLWRPGNPAAELLVVGDGPQRALWWYGEDKDLALPEPGLEARVVAVDGGCEVHVEATSLQRDVAVLADKLDPEAVVSEMLVTLLPGESAVFQVATSATLDESRLTGPDVLRSANQLAGRH